MYYYCICQKSHSHLFFFFLLGLDNVYFLSFRGSSLIGLPFLPSFLFVCCFGSCDVCSVLVYIDVCSDLVSGDEYNILLPTMRSEIFCSLFGC